MSVLIVRVLLLLLQRDETLLLLLGIVGFIDLD